MKNNGDPINEKEKKQNDKRFPQAFAFLIPFLEWKNR